MLEDTVQQNRKCIKLHHPSRPTEIVGYLDEELSIVPAITVQLIYIYIYIQVVIVL